MESSSDERNEYKRKCREIDRHLEEIKFIIENLKTMKPSRELSLAITNLQIANFWLTEIVGE